MANMKGKTVLVTGGGRAVLENGKCGFIAYNDTLSCVQWCAYAKECVGEEMYEAMMKIAQQQKEQRRNKNAS